VNELLSSDVFKLFAIIALGKILERLKFGRFSLGIASVFLVAVAIGSQGISIAPSFQTFGLCVFIYAVGIEAGPQFFASLKAKGASWIAVPFVFIVFTLGLYLLVALALQNWVSGVSMIGLFAGAFTCTPALAAISERIASPMLSVAFGIVYPLTLAGNVYLIPWLPKLFKDNIEALKRAFEEDTRRIYAHRSLAMFRITNPAIFGHTLGELRAFDIEGVVYTRYKNEAETQLARDQVTLRSGGLLAAVGTEESLAKVEMLLGQREHQDVAVPQNLQVKQFIVSNADIAGKTLSSILMKNPLDVRFTRIERSGIELCPDSDKQILLGDRITAIGEEEDMAELLTLLGDDMDSVYQARFAPISIGVAAGFLLGLLPIPFLDSPLGVTAGVLLVAMILGRKVRLFSVLWQIPQATTGFLKQFGLAVFFAVVGTSIGPNVSLIFDKHENWILVPVAIALAFVPTIIMYAIATRLMKKNPLDVLGLLAGTLNNSSALVGINERWKTVVPNTAFAFAYPLGLILVIFSVHILEMLMRWASAIPFLATGAPFLH
jgi:putative transport protein